MSAVLKPSACHWSKVILNQKDVKNREITFIYSLISQEFTENLIYELFILILKYRNNEIFRIWTE